VALIVLAVGFGLARATGITVPLKAQMVVYLVGMVALNLPHGGYEHFENLRRRRPTFRWRYVAVYLGLIAGFVGLFLVAPVVGLGLALVVAIAKGGMGGLRVLDATTGTDHLRTRFQRALAVAVRGGAVMAVPIVCWPETFHAFSALMVGLVDPGGLAPYAAYFDAPAHRRRLRRRARRARRPRLSSGWWPVVGRRRRRVGPPHGVFRPRSGSRRRRPLLPVLVLGAAGGADADGRRRR
jgi:hypothetical protein